MDKKISKTGITEIKKKMRRLTLSKSKNVEKEKQTPQKVRKEKQSKISLFSLSSKKSDKSKKARSISTSNSSLKTTLFNVSNLDLGSIEPNDSAVNKSKI